MENFMNAFVFVCFSCYFVVFIYNLQNLSSLSILVCLTGCIASNQISIECDYSRVIFTEEITDYRLAPQVGFLTFLNIL